MNTSQALAEVRSWAPTNTHLVPTEKTIAHVEVILAMFAHSVDVDVRRRKNGTVTLQLTDAHENVTLIDVDEFSVKKVS